jgi:hypothetical protein
VQQKREVVTNYVKAIVEAIGRLKKDKAFALGAMGKYLRSKDKDVLEGTYEVSVVKYLKTVPFPTVEAFRTVLDELAQVNPKAKGQDPRKFFDDSILRELEKNGFLKSLSR